MEHIKIENDDGLLIIKMARGKANPLNRAMVEELNAALEEARSNESVRGVVLASVCPKFFSGGFDVTEVFEYERELMTSFFGEFIDLYEGMFNLAKPAVAAVSGHAFAGGAVLALASDARVLAEGGFGFALNEINLGIVVSPGMARMAVRAVGVAKTREMVLEGKIFNPAEALEIGLASELAGPDEVLSRAVRRARDLAEKPPLTFGRVKRLFNEVSGLTSSGSDRLKLSEFIEHWFSDECKHHRQALSGRMKDEG
jgi:Delta3-Delta2-enoyl-CoA isomerase